MATIKTIYRSHGELTKRSNGSPNYERYTSDKATRFYGNGVEKDSVLDTFKATQDHHHNYREDFFVGEVIQSFAPSISTKSMEATFHKAGKVLAEKLYSGHQYAVILHTDKKHFHNHILVNPVHPETGKRLDKGAFYSLEVRKASNEIMKEMGLPIPKPRDPKSVNLHYTAMRMHLEGRHTASYDLIKKIDVARSISRNMNEFEDVLGKFGITTRLEKNTISYLHPEKKKGLRSRSLGTNYSLENITKNLAENETVFRSKPYKVTQALKEIDRDVKANGTKNNTFEYIQFKDKTGHQLLDSYKDAVQKAPARKLGTAIAKSSINVAEKSKTTDSEIEQLIIEDVISRAVKRDSKISIKEKRISETKIEPATKSRIHMDRDESTPALFKNQKPRESEEDLDLEIDF